MIYPDGLFIVKWLESLMTAFETLFHPFAWPRWVRRLYVCVLPLSIAAHFTACMFLLFLLLVVALLSNFVVYGLAIWNGENYFK